MKKIISILVFILAFASCSKDEPTTSQSVEVCRMHKIGQYANVTILANGNLGAVVWYNMNSNLANVFYSNNCNDQNKIVYTSETYYPNGQNPTSIYKRRDIILKQ